MKRSLIFLVCLVLGCIACNSSNTTSSTVTESNDTAGAWSSSFYKRYSGTIAGQPVVFSLHKRDNSLVGYYYYVSQGRNIDLTISPDTTVKDGYTVEEANENVDDQSTARWSVTINASGINGKWTSADKHKTYDIALKEDYPAGAYRLATYDIEDSIPYKPGSHGPVAEISFHLLQPAATMDAADADFFNKAILRLNGCDSLHATTIAQCAERLKNEYAKFYRSAIAEVDDTLIGESMNNYYSDQTQYVVYNNDGFLVLQCLGSDYSGGAHGNYGSAFINIDIKEKKIVALGDILNVDSSALSTMLEAEVRKRFNIPVSDKLEDHLLVDKIPVTGNCALGNKGLTFIYTPYEIAAYVFGETQVFIPYSKLKSMLNPAFSVRMNLVY